jgi:cytochrome b pre-mRNA-processing protein 3
LKILSLFLFLMLRRSERWITIRSMLLEISQELVDLFVEDMDHSLRNARLTEKGIDKNFKRFVEGFFGRLVAYDTALDDNSLEQAIYRNVYDGNNDYNNVSKKLGAYIKEQLDKLTSQEDIRSLCFN